MKRSMEFKMERQGLLEVGQEITVMQGGTSYPATALGITPEGHLLVSTPDGERELSSGEVSVRL